MKLKAAKTLGKSIVARFGYKIVSAREPADRESDRLYESVRPRAGYSPWNRDAEFKEVFAAIRDHTLVDRYRCFELWKLVEQSAKLPSGSILEVGVWRGGTGALIAKKAANCSITAPVFLCDTFSGVVKSGSKDSRYRGGEHADTSKRCVEDLLHQVVGEHANVAILEGVFPEDTGHEIEHLKFRLCHIDVDVYQSAKDITEWVWDKMIPGGFIIFDDYGFRRCDGVTKFVNEQMARPKCSVLHNLNGHAIIVKV